MWGESADRDIFPFSHSPAFLFFKQSHMLAHFYYRILDGIAKCSTLKHLFSTLFLQLPKDLVRLVINQVNGYDLARVDIFKSVHRQLILNWPDNCCRGSISWLSKMVQFSALSLGFPRLVEVKNFDLASIHYDLRLGDFIVTVLWEYKSKALAQFYDFDQKHFFFNYEHLSRNYDRFCIERDGRSIKVLVA